MKTKVYSWRLSAALKADLERAARVRKVHVAKVLEMAAKEWLAKHAVDVSSDEEQKRLHAIADQFIGAFSGRDPHRSENVSALVRKKLQRRYGR